MAAKLWKPPDPGQQQKQQQTKSPRSDRRKQAVVDEEEAEGGDEEDEEEEKEAAARVCCCVPMPSASTLARMAAGVSVLDGAMGSLRERIDALRNPRSGALHVELMITYPCTFTPLVDAEGRPIPGTGAGTCDAPGCNAHVRPFHAVAYACATGAGVYAKESPRQLDPLVWARYDVLRSTPEEVYRLKLYCHAMLGATYRTISALTYLCDGLSPFGVDATNGWRYYLRHPMVFRESDWSSPWVAARAASAAVIAALCGVGRALGRCRRRQRRPRGGGGGDADTGDDDGETARLRDDDDDDDAGRVVDSAFEANRVADLRLRRMRARLATWRPADAVESTDDDDDDDSSAGAAVVDQGIFLVEERSTMPRIEEDGGDEADEWPTEELRARRAEADACVTAIMEDELTAVVAVDVYARQTEDVLETSPTGSAAAADKSFDIHEHLRAKNLQMFAVAEHNRRETGELCYMDDWYGQLAVNLRKEGLAVYKGFTCCEYASAAFLFAGMIRTAIDPRTTLLNNVHTQLFLSGRVVRECRVRYEDLIRRESNVRREE